MIHFDPPTEPKDFDSKVRKPENEWLGKHPDAKRPKDLWSPFKPVLADGFKGLCGYSIMYEPVGTVDHFISWNSDKTKAYEWSNYRFCSQWINASKQNANVLDPFEVEDDWFEIILPSLQLMLTDKVPSDLVDLAAYTLERLHLRDDERILRQRREWYRLYEDGELNLAGLRKKAPLLARAIEKQESASNITNRRME